MSKLSHCLLSLVVVLLMVSCSQRKAPEQIVQKGDIKKFLNDEEFVLSTGLVGVQENIEFWEQKLIKHPESLTYQTKLAAAFAQRFRITKNIEDLQRADSLYKIAYESPSGKNVSNLHSLADLSITKHQFEKAYKYSKKALEIGDEKRASRLLLFDALIERGDYQLAKQNLDRLKNNYSFSYLVRLSKFKDYKGQLDSAIHYMENARELVDHDPSLYAWSKSNLGDMYGHANNVEKSYQTYLEVLQMGSSGGSYLHSLEGIAWIAYAHDKNTELAKQILKFVENNIQSPDVKPLLAEIAEFEGDTRKKKQYLREFVREANKPAYYGMYDAYLIDIAASEIDSTDWALELVQRELKDRSTPQIYDLKAWTYFHQGQPEKALAVIKKYVEGQTNEPVSAYHMAEIYKANGLNQKAKECYREVLAASYELGPIITESAKKEIGRL